MKILIAGLLILTSIAFYSCKKEYSCTCTTTGGVSTDAFSVKETKRKAKKKCDDYYQENYSNIALNETSCEIK